MRGTVRKKSTSQKKFKLGLICLIVIISFIGLGKLFSFITDLKKPIDHSTSKTRSWDSKTNLNGVVISSVVQLFSVNPQEKKLIILTLPDETYMDLPFGFGKYPTRSIYGLGQNESPPMGGRLIQETLKATLGMPIDGYIYLEDGWADKSFSQAISEIEQNPFKALSFISSVQSDFSTLELYRLLMLVRQVRSDNISVLDLAQSSITKSLLLPDGTRGYGIDPSKSDLLIQDEAKDVRLADEVLSVGIINATTHPKLAEGVARIITNMGGRVTFTSTLETKLESSIVMGKDSYTKTRLAQIFSPECANVAKPWFGLMQKSKCAINDPEVESSRADVTVVLGEDYYKTFNNK